MSISPSRCKLQAMFSSWEKGYVLGVDGCPDGWIAVALPAHGPIDRAVSIFHPSINHLLEVHNRVPMMIDMPIGLLDRGRRPCDMMARKFLGPRRSSIFSAPRRPMISMASYEEANQWGKDQGSEHGGGLSKQAWAIIPKIRELDAHMTLNLQAHIHEAHPEVAFTRLNKNTPCAHNKKTAEGVAERLQLLDLAGIKNPQILHPKGKDDNWHYEGTLSRIRVAKDDVIDAAACALSARAKINFDPSIIHLWDGGRDNRNLRLEIWG